MKKNLFGKLALLGLIVSIFLYIMEAVTHFDFFFVFAVVADLFTVCMFLVWICCLVFGKFKYSLNVIVSFLLLCATVLFFFFFVGEMPQLTSSSDILTLSIEEIIFIGFLLAFVISVIVLFVKLIFGSSKKDEPVEKVAFVNMTENQTTKLPLCYQCKNCGWIPEDQTKAPKYCIECGTEFENVFNTSAE